MQLLLKYFPQLTPEQLRQFAQLPPLYEEWNQKINVVSRKDLDNLEERHLLHSLTIAHWFPFLPEARVMDLGTGGGFPGIPLAILFPQTHFLLVDSIGKKIKVVEEIAKALGLSNVRAIQSRGEDVKETFDYVVSRAVTQLKTLHHWASPLVSKENKHSQKNGLIALKGGDLKEELQGIKQHVRIFNLNEVFTEAFFETKSLIFVPR